MELINELKNLDKCSKDIQVYTLKRFAVLLGPVALILQRNAGRLSEIKRLYLKTLFGLIMTLLL